MGLLALGVEAGTGAFLWSREEEGGEVDPGKRPTGNGAERKTENLRKALISMTVRRRLGSDQVETVNIHATETYIRRSASNWLALPAHLEDCKGCYFLG